LKGAPGASTSRPSQNGAIAQLGERLHGMQEVVGSIPSGSTILLVF
jgi:hypothetical protein